MIHFELQRVRVVIFPLVVLMLFAILDWREEAIAASPTTATLVVEKGGDRTAPQSVDGLAGATFDFFAGTSFSPPLPGAIPTASCTTDASGTCSVDVPGRTGFSQGYWIRENAAPAGWTAPSVYDVGTGAATVPTNYSQVFTGAVANNQTYTFPVAGTGSSPTSRDDFWSDIRDNPDLPGDCGLNIALLLDISGSVAPFINDLKTAANGFVDALTGTPSQIAVFTFATGANSLAPLTSVADASSAAPLKTAINGVSANGGTNWDAGLWQVAAATATFDAVLMLTDGNPTFYGPDSSGPGNATRFREVENGVASANAVKALGTKVIAVGVGDGVTGSTDNLKAISGPVANVDYFQTDYAALGSLLRAIALKNCLGTVTVVKRIIPPGGGIPDATPGPDWEFGTSTAGVTPSSGTTAPVTGAVNFVADLSGATSKPVTLQETPQAGYTLVQQGGFNASCTADGSPATVTNDGANGFTVSALSEKVVSCTVYNQAPTPPATVVVNKKWVINGTSYPEPTQPSNFQATLSLTKQVQPQWGQTYGGYLAGDNVTIAETINNDLLPIGCTNTPSGGLGDKTLVAGLNTYTVTNTVVCVTKLTLKKEVRNIYPAVPSEDASSWTLTTYNPDSSIKFSGTTGVSGSIEAEVRYPLGESVVPGYAQEVVDGATITPPSTGSWHCTLEAQDGSQGPEYDGLNGSVTVEIGQHATCTAFNDAQPAKLTLVKSVTNSHGGTAQPSDWTVSATPPGDSGGLPVTGPSGSPAVTLQDATPGAKYALAESGPSGYDYVGVSCLVTGTQTEVPVTDGAVTPSLAQDITCTFSNKDQPGGGGSGGEPILPVTGHDLVTLISLGLGATTAGLLLLGIRRRKTA